VLVSGTGRSLENLAERVEAGGLDVELALVLSDRAGVKALERARRLGIDATVVAWSKELGKEAFAERVFAEVEERGCELVVLAGFLRLLLIPETWRGRVINIHPALLPDFGGKGFYGDRVHGAVLESGAPETGCTVHFVDNTYDTGPHVLQRRVPVLAGDTVDTLAARVFEAEKEALPEAIRRVLAGEARLDD
jgi:phosphoribosylglycinamide formyltransferase-1